MYTQAPITLKETAGNITKQSLEPNNKMCVEYYAGGYLEDNLTMEEVCVGDKSFNRVMLRRLDEILDKVYKKTG